MLEEYTKTDSVKNLDEMNPDVQQMLLRLMELFSQSADRQAKELSDFREHLESLDQMIQEYQDMADGKSCFADGLTEEEALELLISAKQKREDYLQEGVKHLNKSAEWIPGSFYQHGSLFQKVFGTNPFAGKKSSDFMLYIPSNDIYAEIDHALENARGVGNIMKNGICRIADALEKKGYGEFKYKLYWETENASALDERWDFMTELSERLDADKRHKRILNAPKKAPLPLYSQKYKVCHKSIKKPGVLPQNR